MATVYLPVQPTYMMNSRQRADAINAEFWWLTRPGSVQSPNDVTKHHYGDVDHPSTGQVAIVGDTDDDIKIHNEVDLTVMLTLLPEVPQSEKDQLVQYIDANKGGTVKFGTLIPSTSVSLTEEEADAAGWIHELEDGEL